MASSETNSPKSLATSGATWEQGRGRGRGRGKAENSVPSHACSDGEEQVGSREAEAGAEDKCKDCLILDGCRRVHLQVLWGQSQGGGRRGGE